MSSVVFDLARKGVSCKGRVRTYKAKDSCASRYPRSEDSAKPRGASALTRSKPARRRPCLARLPFYWPVAAFLTDLAM